MNKNIQMQSKKRGLALPLVLCAVLILAILGIGLLTLGYQTRLRSIKTAADIAARCAADAGLTKAMYDMNAKLAAGSWNDSTLPSASNVTLPGSNLIYSYNITKDCSGIYTIASTGNSSTATKTVYAPLSITGPPYAILVVSTLYQKNNGTITGSCGTLSAAAGAFSIAKGLVTGDAFVGIGGNPADITCTVNGQKYALSAPQIVLGEVSVPSSATTANPNTAWNTPSNYTLGTVGSTTYVRYTGVTINGTLNINGNVVMYVNGDLSNVGSGINVNNNSSLKLYISGNFGPGGNGVDLSSTTNDPSVLKIYGVGAAAQEFTLGKNKATTVASIYAPKANIAIGKNKAVLKGQIIANSFSNKNSADVQYDARAATSWTASDPLAKFVVKGWHE
jgi:Tfp pilus assembly protein PilX